MVDDWDYRLVIKRGNWTSTRDGAFNRKITYFHGGFSIAMFEYRMVYNYTTLYQPENGIALNQWPFREPIDWRDLPYNTIYIYIYIKPM